MTIKERYFPRSLLIFLAIFAAAALLIGVVGALLRKDSVGNVVLSGLEAAILAFLGGLIARSFINFLLWLGRDSDNASLVLGWAFFLWPGIFDTVARLFGKKYLTRPVVLLWIAASVGAFSGMMDGMWQTHNWAGPGAAAFILDETWGLAGTTNGDLLHLVNFSWGDHAVGEIRTDAHRYNKGFAVKGGFAFTQGAVMSSNTESASMPLFFHEDTHVWQNRLAGPFYTLTYIGWMLVFLIPGAIAGLISKDGAGAGIQAFSYFSNPWEAMGYAVGESHGADDRLTFGPLIWSDGWVIFGAVLFYLVALAGVVWVIYRVWFKAGTQPVLAAGY